MNRQKKDRLDSFSGEKITEDNVIKTALSGYFTMSSEGLSEQMDALNEILQNNERLKLAQEVSSSGTWDWDIVNDRYYWSEEFILVFGMKPGVTPGFDTWRNALHPDDVETAMNRIQDAVLNGNNLDNEYRIILPDGKIRWIRATGRTFYKDDKPVRMLGLCTDITEHKHIQQMLLESEERFRLALKNAPVSVAAQDRDLRFIWAYNQRTVDPFAVIGKTDTDLFSASDAQLLMNLKRQVMESGAELRRQLWITSNNKKVFIDLYLEPFRDESGNIIGVGIATVELTPMKLIEDALKQSEATLLGILNATSESIWLFDVQGNVLLANQTAIKRMKMTAEKIIGKSIFKLVPKELGASRFKAISEAAQTGQPVHLEDMRAGINFEHTFYPVAGPDGKINRVVAFSRDITERKRTEQELIKSHEILEALVKERTSELQKTNEILKKEIEERIKAEIVLKESQKNLRALSNRMQAIAEEERTRMAREIHDELGYLLTALKYDIENLSGDPYSPSDSMLSELESMKNMVDLLIDSVRKIVTELRPGILDHLGLLPAIEWQINQFRIRTKLACECSIHDIELSFDKNENTIIFRILQEILTNIARHSKADKIWIRVNRENNRFLLQVMDNGIGFKVMDISPSASLGLMGMRERAISIGGELQIESVPGKGTTITLMVNERKDLNNVGPGSTTERKPGKRKFIKRHK